MRTPSAPQCGTSSAQTGAPRGWGLGLPLQTIARMGGFPAEPRLCLDLSPPPLQVVFGGFLLPWAHAGGRPKAWGPGEGTGAWSSPVLLRHAPAHCSGAQREEQRWAQTPHSPAAPRPGRAGSGEGCPTAPRSSPVRMATLAKQPSSLLSRTERKLSAASTLASRVLWS